MDLYPNLQGPGFVHGHNKRKRSQWAPEDVGFGIAGECGTGVQCLRIPRYIRQQDGSLFCIGRCTLHGLKCPTPNQCYLRGSIDMRATSLGSSVLTGEQPVQGSVVDGMDLS